MNVSAQRVCLKSITAQIVFSYIIYNKKENNDKFIQLSVIVGKKYTLSLLNC